MAKPKKTYLIEKLTDIIHIYHVDLKFVMSQIMNVEGTTYLNMMKTSGLVSVCIHPLYDIDEIASEIEELLCVDKVPEVFRDQEVNEILTNPRTVV